MERAIVGFEQDELGDWRAILACGHRQHIRHNPPFVERPWVLTEEGRARFLGVALDCKACDEGEPVSDAPLSAAELEAIYKQFRADLLGFIAPRVAGSDTAEGVLWRICCQLPARVDDLSESDKVTGWLYALIRDALLTGQGRTGEQLYEPAAPVEDTQGGSVAALTSAVRGLLACLPGEYRQALTLIEFHNLSPGDVADRLDIATTVVESGIRRGRAMLCEALLDWCRSEYE